MAREASAVQAMSGVRPGRGLLLSILATVAAWYAVYISLGPASKWLTYVLLGLPVGTHISSSIEFFIFEVPKVMMLLVLVVFAVGIVRTFFTPERTRRLLSGRREAVGNVMAAMLGIVTPFCSCSACPLFIGFVESGIPLGVTFSFLLAAPMINEVALVLLFGMFGPKVAGMYVGTGLVISIVSGAIIGRLHMERYVEPWVYEMHTTAEAEEQEPTWVDRVSAGRRAVREIVGKVWPYVIAGIAVGAGIHGFVPIGVLAGVMGKDVWWSVPVAVLLGVPLYSNAAGIVPIVSALLEKGSSLGTALAFMMAVIAISPPEMVILRKVLKPRLIAVFIGLVTVGIVIVGFLFNAIL